MKHPPTFARGAISVLAVLALAGPVLAQDDPRNDATDATKSANAALLSQLPFDNTEDFETAKKGLIAPLPSDVIKGAEGNPIWNPQQYGFITEGADAPDTVNPSLWRQSQLINIGGLFEVTDGIYQVRNQDLSNMTIIEGTDGITVIDPLVSAETAKVAIDLYRANRGDKPVKAVIYTHSHVDHYGGVRGVIDEADVKSGKVKIYAPEGFLNAAVSENVMAGNAMSRRASYMYGNLLPADEKGQVGAGLGTTTSAGTVTLIPPTDIIDTDFQTETIDGLTYEFLLAPDSEAPSEMLWYIKEKKAIEAAEDSTHTLHNTYSLRGAKIRDPLKWSKYLNTALKRWGDEAEVMFMQHHWPVFGTDQIKEHLTKQRDLYRFINDETLRLANQGYTMREIADQVELPESLATFWSNRGYYGSMYHDVAATYVLYLGWFDGNPATLHELPPVDAAQKYVDFMGGPEAVLEKAKASYDAGEYRWVAEVVKQVVFADPDNQQAKDLEAAALEQMGYQAESGPWRNFYLSGAQELRKGIAELPAPNTASPDTIKAMDLDLLFDFVAMRLNGPKTGDAASAFNIDFTDTGDKYLLELENGVLNHTKDAQSDSADATVTMTRETLNNVLLGQTTMADAVKAGDVTVDGDQGKLEQMLANLDSFPFWFNIVTP